jgi:hypothetical protein
MEESILNHGVTISRIEDCQDDIVRTTQRTQVMLALRALS